MTWDWKPAKPAFLDFETQSATPLTTTHKYASAEDTRVLCCSVRVDGVTHGFGPYLDGEAKQKLANIAEERVLVVHNAPFDKAIWDHSAKLPPARWCDTLPKARQAGLPGKLDDLGKLFFGQGKDEYGKKLVQLLCILRAGQRAPAIGPAHGLLQKYCNRDTELLEQIYDKVADYGEPDVMTTDATINQRGIPLDRAYGAALLGLFEHNKQAMTEEFHSRFGDINPGSVDQVKQWLRDHDFKLPQTGSGRESLDKFAYKDFCAHPHDFYLGDEDGDAAVSAVLEMLELRREIVRVGKSKAAAAFEGIEFDSRIRDQHVYHKAHTGRWAGRGLQIHNMPRGGEIDARYIQPTYEDVCRAAREASEASAAKGGPRILNADVLNAMLRCMIRCDNLLVADYNAVEARCLAWIARCDRMLAVYNANGSPYMDMGAQVFGRPLNKKNDVQEYNMSKTLVLGCGYGMSGAKFEFTCKSRGISTAVFAKAGMKAAEAVKVYRNTYPEIPAVWKAFHNAIHSAVGGSDCIAGRCLFTKVGSHMHCVLPSGRVQLYRNIRIELLVPGYAKLYNMPLEPVPTVVFDLPTMWGDKPKRGFLYGSKVCENVCQAICRDMLADTLVRCEQAGMKPVFHVHDEVGLEEPEEKLPEFMELMSTGPKWADGFPVLAEGYSGPIWSKVAKGYKELSALNGRAI